jgi:hypothetical protein
MKTTFFAVFAFALAMTSLQASTTTSFSPNHTPVFNRLNEPSGEPLDIRVVISQKRIWLVTDEMPMKCLKTIVKDASGKIVLEKCFTSKCSEWFLNIEALPKGEYTLILGDRQIEQFKK